VRCLDGELSEDARALCWSTKSQRQLDTGEGFIFSVGKEPAMKDACMSSLSQYFRKAVYQTE
jgi:hypothetical protein